MTGTRAHSQKTALLFHLDCSLVPLKHVLKSRRLQDVSATKLQTLTFHKAQRSSATKIARCKRRRMTWGFLDPAFLAYSWKLPAYS